MDNTDLENVENERAAVAMLLAAAQAMQDAPAPAPEPEPGNIDDLHSLFQRQKQLVDQQTAFKKQEAELLADLQLIREQSAELDRQAEAVKARAAILFETLFGKSERPAPRQIPPVAKPEVSNASPELVVRGASDYTRIPSLSL